MHKLRKDFSIGLVSALVLGFALGLKFAGSKFANSFVPDILFFIALIVLFFSIFKFDNTLKELERKKIRKPVLKWENLKTKR
jgi:hypothetical protein